MNLIPRNRLDKFTADLIASDPELMLVVKKALKNAKNAKNAKKIQISMKAREEFDLRCAKLLKKLIIGGIKNMTLKRQVTITDDCIKMIE